MLAVAAMLLLGVGPSKSPPCAVALDDAIGLHMPQGGGVLCFVLAPPPLSDAAAAAMGTTCALLADQAGGGELPLRHTWDAQRSELRCEVPPALSPRVTQLRITLVSGGAAAVAAAGGGLLATARHWVLRSDAPAPTHVNMGSGRALVSAPGWVNLDSLRGLSEDWGSAGLQTAATAAFLARWEAGAGLRFLETGSVSVVNLHCMLYTTPLAVGRLLLAEARRVLAPGGAMRVAEASDGKIWASDGAIGLPAGAAEAAEAADAAADAAAVAAGAVLRERQLGQTDVERPLGSLRHWVLSELRQALGFSGPGNGHVVEVGPFRTRIAKVAVAAGAGGGGTTSTTTSPDLCVLHALHPLCRDCAKKQLGARREGRPYDFSTCWKCHFNLGAPPPPGDVSAGSFVPFVDTWDGFAVHFGHYWALEATLQQQQPPGEAVAEASVSPHWPWGEDVYDTRDCFHLGGALLN